MSKHCGELRVGDTLDVKGPMNKMAYTPNMKSHVGLVAGGSGITPMLQIINAALELKADDNTKLHLLYASIAATLVLLSDVGLSIAVFVDLNQLYAPKVLTPARACLQVCQQDR